MSLHTQNLEDPLSKDSQFRALFELGIPFSELALEVQEYCMSKISDAQKATTSSDVQDEQTERDELQQQQVPDESDGLRVDDASDFGSPSEGSSSATHAPLASTSSDVSWITAGSSEDATVLSPTYACELRNAMSDLQHNSADHSVTQSTRPMRFDVATDARLSAANMRRTPGRKIFPCPYHPFCKSTFTRSTSIKEHMKLHINMKPCACDKPGCAFKTTTKKLLRSHVQHMHEKKGEQSAAGH